MDPTPWLDEEEAAAWRGWLTLGMQVRAAVGRDLARDHGLSEPEYAVLVQLSEAPDTLVRMSELAAGLIWSKSRLSHLVSRMEAKGLVSRRECPEDGRGALASLTPNGAEELRRAAPSHVASVRRHFFDHLQRDEVRALAAITTAVLAGMGTPANCADRRCGSDDDLDTPPGGCEPGPAPAR